MSLKFCQFSAESVNIFVYAYARRYINTPLVQRSRPTRLSVS